MKINISKKKPLNIFSSVDRQETTVLTSLTNFIHHGMAYVSMK